MTVLSSVDFASAAMLRVLLRGMELLGMERPVLPQLLNQARVPLELKRAVVGAAVEQGGLACLPLLGRGVRDFAMEPAHLALTAGRDAGSLFVRWQRLERYIHSRHRIRIVEIAECSANIVHIHRDNGPPPLPVEDLLVCGVLCALMEALGLKEVKAQAAGAEVYPNPKPQRINALVGKGQSASWRFEWKSPQTFTSPVDLSVSWAQVAPHLWSELAHTAGGLVARDLPELLPLGIASGQLELSSRSVQRALAYEGLTYRGLVSEVRFRLAGWYLIKTTIPIAEVGFICGYSDQAHLTREFSRRVGLAPGKYRGNFASRVPGAIADASLAAP